MLRCPNRRGMPIHKAAAILRKERGRQWDATVVDALLRSIADQLERPAPPLHLVRDDEADASGIVASA